MQATRRERRLGKSKELPPDPTGNHWQSQAEADVVCPPLHQIMSVWLGPVLAGPSTCSAPAPGPSHCGFHDSV